MDGCANSFKTFKLYYVIKAITYNALPICDLVLTISLNTRRAIQLIIMIVSIVILRDDLNLFGNLHMSKMCFCKFIQICIDACIYEKTARSVKKKKAISRLHASKDA
jgi:hypothetical protein